MTLYETQYKSTVSRLAIALLIETAVYAAAMAWACHTLRGVSGDVAGFALSAAECAGLIALTGIHFLA